MTFNSVTGKNWIFKEFSKNKVSKISETFSLDFTLSKLIAIRNIDLDNLDQFLKPTIKNSMPNPLILKDMSRGIDRFAKAIQRNEIIGIFGDYDVDGATSSALLVNYLKAIKRKFHYYIPDRQKDGYGPNANNFAALINKGVNLIITLDCGTTSFDAINYANKHNVNVIVLDHHQSDIKLPSAFAIINPNKINDNSNLNYLCAAGVTLMFLVALNAALRNLKWFDLNNINEPNIINFLDLVSLGTVCDLVPLIKLNRAIVSQGLKLIGKRKNIGLKTLYDICGIKSKPSTYHLGYMIGPRINAGGRVGKSSYGADLLSCDDSQQAFKISQKLNEYNLERQTIEAKLLDIIENEAANYSNDPVLVLNGDDWHEGVTGIVAARLKDKYQKPIVLISFTGINGKGSCRSVHGFDIGAAILSAVHGNILEKGGGHKMAAGFSIKKNNLSKLKNFLVKRFINTNLNLNFQKNLYLDSIISTSALNEDFFDLIDQLSPFGSGNSEPRFVIENLRVARSFSIKNKHIKTIFKDDKSSNIVKGIAFNCKNTILEEYLTKKINKTLNIAGKLSLNEWHGKKEVEFVVDDISIN